MFTTYYFLNTLHRAMFVLCMLSIAAFVQANTLTASVDRDSIGLQETLTLIVTADEQTKDAPDFSALKNDFDILSTQRSASIRIINGRTESSTDWHITLAPKHAGTLLIPSFNVDNAVSDAIEIKVSESHQAQSNADEPVHVTIELDKNTAFVQEQILIKIKLITRVNLSQAEMQPLELKNALVVNLDQKQYQTNINGTTHLVVETSLALFPQESGEIIIPRLSYNVAMETGGGAWNDPFGRRRNNILRLSTDEQVVTVKPALTSPTHKTWQPANQLALNETWSNSLASLKVGEPITRTITITADGLTGGQIAPIVNSELDGLTFYPDQAQTKDSKSVKGVQGSRVETIAIVPNRGGDFTLPEINVEWWDNKTQSLQIASLPATTVHVSGDATAPQANIQIKDHSLKNTDVNTASASALPTQTTNSSSPWLWALTILFALLSILLAFYAWKLKTRLDQWQADQEASDRELDEKEKNIWDRLKDAAANKDAPALRKAVLSWAKFQWPTQQIHTLDEIAKLATNKDLTAALKQLDELLYSNHENTEWDAVALLKLLNECRKEKKTRKNTAQLKGLYQ